MGTRGTQPGPRPGLLAGKYRLIEMIGQGAMAVVWRAEMPGRAAGGRPAPPVSVAIKKMKVGLVGGHDYIAMFMEEARVGVELRHPNIVQVYDLTRDEEGNYCLVMELVPGIDLRGLLIARREMGKPLPWELATFIVVQALHGLTAAHERTTAAGASARVIHRDISPSNILLGEAGAVKLADFGLARALDRGRSLTAPGIIKGKLAYLAPELTGGARASPQSDIFAMGCVLWEALAGRPLYSGEDDLALFRKVQAAEIRPIEQERGDLPKDLPKVLHQALEPRPERRIGSARAMAIALSLLLKKSGRADKDAPRALTAAVGEARLHRERSPGKQAPSETFELSSTDVEP